MKKRLLLVTVLLILLLTATAALAQGGEKQVGLVIQFPDRVYTEVVTVPADATTADVLEAANIPVGMADTDFGKAVCNIDEVGNPVDNCFADPENFWAYFHLNPAGDGWEVSQVGISGYVPADKAVEGFAWSGFDADYNPTTLPPVKTFDEIAGGGSKFNTTTLLWIGAGVLLAIIVVAVVWRSRKPKAA
jgi:hypothetical protein